MKLLNLKIKLIITLLKFTYNFVICQQIEIEFIKNTLNTVEHEESSNSFLNEARKLRYERWISFTLNINGKESVFKKSPEYKQYKTNKTVPVSTWEKDIYLKNFNDKKLKGQIFLLNTYDIEDELNQIDWEMSNESINLLGYQCFKATTKNCEGRTMIVWYTPQIPIPDGPIHLHGLPGLILKVELLNIYGQVSTTLVAENIDTMGCGEEIDKLKVKKTITMSGYCDEQASMYKKFEEMAKSN